MTDPRPQDASNRDEALLLASIEGMLAELGGARARKSVTLDSRLDADLGFDSLSRVELVSRLEREFRTRLAQRVIAEAETPRDLLRALRARPAEAVAVVPPPVLEGALPQALEEAPGELPTLVDALEWHAARHPERVHVHFVGEDEQVTALRYGELLDGACTLAGGLVARGLQPGESVAIMLPTGRDYLQSFLAILLAGAVPVPIYPPARVKQIEEHFRRHARILDNAGARMLITFDQVRRVSRLLTARVGGLDTLVTPQELAAAGPLDLRPAISAEHVAFLQYTSGSTGDPKGVVLTHGDILASLRCMGDALQVSSRDLFVSWLPLYHDMGLIGAWLGALVVGFPLVLMSPLTFLSRPERWLRTIQRFRATISGGPNFAYELCLRRIPDEALAGLDLSSWRLAFNGAEPVSAETVRRFSARFADVGFEPAAMTPVYGLAEATLGVAFTPVGRGARVDRVEREALYAEGVARPSEDADSLTFVSSGLAIPEFEVRCVDEAGRELPDRAEGEIEFKGSSTTSGYHRNPEATADLFHGAWLRSGDRGYLADGELYITGRIKDVVIRAGRNLYPYELEQAVADVAGVRRGCVAVFGSHDPADGTERLVVLAETRERDEAVRGQMREQIETLAVEHLGLPADEVVLAPPQTVLKTSSGKIRRAALAERYQRGRLLPRQRPLWLQLARLAQESLVPGLRRALRRSADVSYAAWFGIVLAVLAVAVWPLVAVLPGARRRWRVARWAARTLFAATGIRLDVRGAPPTDAGGAVLVSNHQSYLDGLVLVACLARPVRFVAKRELEANAIARRFLDGLGVLYVERFDRAQTLEDARALELALADAQHLAFFAEGTFHRMPGLLPFQLGAFELAVAHGAELCPVILRGTRNVLRGDDWFPRRAPVAVEFLKSVPVPAVAEDARWSAAVALRKQIRAAMLRRCGEPDLADRRVLTRLAAGGNGGAGVDDA